MSNGGGDLKAGKEEGRRSEVLSVVSDTRTAIQNPSHIIRRRTRRVCIRSKQPEE